jgi:hypothetical protein
VQKSALKLLTVSSLLKLTELDKNNSSEQSKRTALSKTGWEQKDAPSTALDPKVSEETA